MKHGAKVTLICQTAKIGVGCLRLVRHNQRAAGLGDFAHLAIEVFNGTCSVLAEHQPTDTVLRGVAI